MTVFLKMGFDGQTIEMTPQEIASLPMADPLPPPSQRPREIHAAWLRAALAEAGKLSAVNAAVAQAGPVKQALWEYATTLNDADTDIIAIASSLKIDLAALFDRAEAIRDTRQA
jgi:hypothetical protein